MRIVIQRTNKASVKVNETVVGKINQGLVILVGFTNGDTEQIMDKMIKKLLNIRIFNDDNNVMNKSILDINGSILSISQFTLYADTKKGNRPSYNKALEYEKASNLYNIFNNKLKQQIHTEMGIFGSDMQVQLVNDGPVTIILESEELYG